MIRIKLKNTDQSFTVDDDLAKRFEFLTGYVSFHQKENPDFLTSIFSDGYLNVELSDESYYHELKMACENIFYFISSLNGEDQDLLNRLGYTGSLYDPIYLSIYDEEKHMRHVEGFDGCFDLSEFNFDEFEFEYDGDPIGNDHIKILTGDDMGLTDIKTIDHKVYEKRDNTKISPSFNQQIENPEYELTKYHVPHAKRGHKGTLSEYFPSAKETIKAVEKLIQDISDEYKNFIVVAGGAALKSYNNESINRSDVDLFIHSCDQNKATEIVEAIFRSRRKVWHSKQTISSLLNVPLARNRRGHDVNFQVILRLYNSPSEIILGFDVDSSCILYDLRSHKFYGTKRFIYAQKYMMNVVNFDRMSPSYECRLKKFVKRGYGIYIPGYEMMVRSVSLDRNLFQGASALLNYVSENDMISDYELNGVFIRGFPEEITFKVQDPGEQAIGTFHRLVYDDPKEWYGYDDSLPDFVIPELDNNVICEYSFQQLMTDRESTKDKRYKNVVIPKNFKRNKIPYLVNELLMGLPFPVVLYGEGVNKYIEDSKTAVQFNLAIVGSDDFYSDFISTILMVQTKLITKYLPMLLDFDIFGELDISPSFFLCVDELPKKDRIREYHPDSEGENTDIYGYLRDDQHEDITQAIDGRFRVITDEINQLEDEEPSDDVAERIEALKELKRKVESVHSFVAHVPNFAISYVNYRTIEQVIEHQESVSNKVVMKPTPEGGKFYMSESKYSSIVNRINYEYLSTEEIFNRIKFYNRSIPTEGYVVDRKLYIDSCLNG